MTYFTPSGEKWLLGIIIVVCSYCRVHWGVHYVSDCVFGFV